ncbi:SRPBCC domain-containing protein [Pelomonas sp. V22]|uniref:SRPBCC domain-containing protein n=1 Tax=Pelomonas sp. V22 TaxID=2822139 RepID=UPI0024A8D7B2|nr:SRPBCC domain-containing protein [Pelomonas sp. V22]MDI4632239.1 SRPBCC domain-containing protein [Pelomonas sp. V22]
MNCPTDSPEQPPAGSGEPAGLPPRTLPFAKWWPFLSGALLGIVLRLIFSGNAGNAFTAMDTAFIYFVPVAVGGLAVYVAETRQRRSWRYYLWAPVLANSLFVLGTLLILIEGAICAIIVLPLFGLLGAAGGLIMGIACRLTMSPRGVALSLSALPLLLGGLPAPLPNPARIQVIERTVQIEAPPERIWQELHGTRDIRPDEVEHAWMYRIGVPLPLAGVTETSPEGRVRKVTMGKAIHFEQVAAEWEQDRHVRWTYRFQKDSIPPGALDDHVTIGGHYFDLIDTAYTLTPKAGQTTELRIQMRYRVSTQFNWYADGVARLLIGNFEDVILQFYRRRAMRQA